MGKRGATFLRNNDQKNSVDEKVDQNKEEMGRVPGQAPLLTACKVIKEPG